MLAQIHLSIEIDTNYASRIFKFNFRKSESNGNGVASFVQVTRVLDKYIQDETEVFDKQN